MGRDQQDGGVRF